MNRYNAAALLAEKSAAVGITPNEEREAERLFEEVAGIWTQQKENESMRCVIRSYNRMITYFLKTSRTKFPDLRCVPKFTTTVTLIEPPGVRFSKAPKLFVPISQSLQKFLMLYLENKDVSKHETLL